MRNLPAAKWEGQLGRAGPLQWMAMARGANTLGRGDSDGGPVPHSLVKVFTSVCSALAGGLKPPVAVLWCLK